MLRDDYLDIFLDPLIVVITFIIGYWVSNLISKNKEKRRLRSIYEFFKDYLNNQFPGIQSQIDLIKEYKDNISGLKGISNVSITVVPQPYFLLDSINLEDLFSAWRFKKRRNTQDLIDILKMIEFSKVTFNGYFENHKTFTARQINIYDNWRAKIKEFHDLKAELTKIPVEEIKANPDLVNLNQIYNNWVKGNKDQITEVVEFLAEPLIDHYTPIYGQNPNNEIALSLIKAGQGLRIIYKEWFHHVKDYSEKLDSFVITLELGFKKALEIKNRNFE